MPFGAGAEGAEREKPLVLKLLGPLPPLLLSEGALELENMLPAEEDVLLLPSPELL
tara:strand:+ start:386 stop:553 length:168 start_codon:yes stop_codon:yes gene_type:complete